MTQTLLQILPNPNDLLALEPEDLGAVIIETAPGVMQNGMFTVESLRAQLFPSGPKPGYPAGLQRDVVNALAEAMARLENLGLVIHDPDQHASSWYRLTRRAQALTTRADVEQFRKGRMLPADLLQPVLTEKVWPLFLRGDYDIAVFQAFKVVEVAVRNAANAKGAGYPADLVGVDLMQKALNMDAGPLSDAQAPAGERKAEMFLFAGAMGHARNPTGHHDTNLPPESAARLIVFASHLLGIVYGRK